MSSLSCNSNCNHVVIVTIILPDMVCVHQFHPEEICCYGNQHHIASPVHPINDIYIDSDDLENRF